MCNPLIHETIDNLQVLLTIILTQKVQTKLAMPNDEYNAIITFDEAEKLKIRFHRLDDEYYLQIKADDQHITVEFNRHEARITDVANKNFNESFIDIGYSEFFRLKTFHDLVRLVATKI